MLHCFNELYYFLLRLINLTESEVEKINKLFDKNDLYVDYI